LNFKVLPKSIKRAIRYIYQDAPVEHLKEIQVLINQAIDHRLKEQK
jgi:stage III sporulation protein SpoIIIAA